MRKFIKDLKTLDSIMRKLENELLVKLKLYFEGKAAILGPDLASYATPNGHIDPARAPIFYNPRMKCNRDMSILALRAYIRYSSRSKLVGAEPLCATGVRSIRYALEVDGLSCIIASDIDQRAYKLATVNVRINTVEDIVKVLRGDANYILSKISWEEGKLDFVDIDPYGSPMKFINSALLSLKHGGLFMATATDLPVLMGVYPKACFRRYSAYNIKVPFSYEAGLRILLGAIIREAIKLDFGVKVLLAYYLDHYYRIFLVKYRSGRVANESASLIGFIEYCPKCGLRRALKHIEEYEGACINCKHASILLGPLWLGPLCDSEFIKYMLENIEKNEEDTFDKRIRKLLTKMIAEIDQPFYYRVDEKVFLNLVSREISPKTLVTLLREEGYAASLSALDPKGFKTDAGFGDILKLLKKNVTII